MKRSLVLASASPRRRELIQLLELPWASQAAEVDESSVSHPDPAEDVIQTAKLKANAVVKQAPAGVVIVAADTTVVLDGERLNKPADAADARRMLVELRGRQHEVHTGIVVLDSDTGKTIIDVASIDVPMRNYSEQEVDAYVATGDPLDKAGAYAIQHPGFRPVVDLEGCYAGVMGLPLCHLSRALRQVGVDVDDGIAARCQAYHDYGCPIFQSILG